MTRSGRELVVLSGRRAPIRITRNGEKIGEIFRYTGRKGYGLALQGVYWDREDNPTRRGGRASKAFRTVREAIAAVDATLVALGPEPMAKKQVESAAEIDVAEVAELLSWLYEFTEQSAVGKDFVWRVVRLLRYLDARLPPLPL